MKNLKIDKELVKNKCKWVKSGEDIDTDGETEDYKTGYTDALEWLLFNGKECENNER